MNTWNWTFKNKTTYSGLKNEACHIVVEWTMPPPKILKLNAQTPSVTVFGDRVFKKVIKVKWHHKSGTWSNRICVLKIEETPQLPLNSADAQRKAYVRTVRRQLAISQEECPHQNQLWSGTSSLQNCEKINFCCLSHQVCGILWQPEQTDTHI